MPKIPHPFMFRNTYRKIYALIITIFLCPFSLKAQTENHYQEMIALITEAYNAQEYKKISDQFSATMQQAISEADFANFLASVQAQLGKIQKVEFARKKGSMQIHHATFEQGNLWEIWFGLNQEGKITGFQIIPYGTSSKQINVMEFIKNNPERAAIKLNINGKTILEQNSTRKMPLASTAKIIVAVEYAQQVANGKISPQQEVQFADLDLYYLPKTDGGAHTAWKKNLEKEQKTNNNTVSLEEVAQGMVTFSSNANTEYLMDRLGLENINQNISALGLKNHDPLFYMVSDLLVFQAEKNENAEAHLARIAKLSKEEMAEKANQMHQNLKADQQGKFKKSQNLLSLTLEAQKIWSDKQTAATVEDYVSLMEKINSRSYFSPEVQKNIEIILGNATIKSPRIQEMMLYSGYKGGSTAFVLTMAMYGTSKENKQIAFAYFLDNLTPEEQQQLQNNAGNFNLELLRK
jgi:D-alanyl-D-alanine carboxypeptidase